MKKKFNEQLYKINEMGNNLGLILLSNAQKITSP